PAPGLAFRIYVQIDGPRIHADDVTPPVAIGIVWEIGQALGECGWAVAARRRELAVMRVVRTKKIERPGDYVGNAVVIYVSRCGAPRIQEIVQMLHAEMCGRF